MNKEPLAQRKPTRLSGYSYSTDGQYFITICAKDKQPTFGKVVGGGVLDAPRVLLSPLGKVIRTYLLSINRTAYAHIDRYVVMPNHLHVLLSVSSDNGTSKTPSPTNDTVPHIVSTFKRFVNRQIGSPVFQRGYYDHIIRNELDYQRICEYIENNPARWKDDCYFIK